MTATTALELIGRSFQATNQAIARLVGVGILAQVTVGRRNRAFEAPELIEAFGTERSFFGTNWPVDRMYSSYAAVVEAYREIISDFSRDEQEALFSRNAERVYRI